MSEKKKAFQQPDLTIEDLSKALYESNITLQKTMQERDEIYANISHDLRSPITAIHNAIEYLMSLDRISEQDIRTVLPLLQERTLVLEKMINEIFLLTKLDSSTSLLHMKNIPLTGFLEDFFFSCNADSKYQNRKLILDLPENFNITVCIDTAYMTRVLDNLFSNALKYTHDGDSITLSAHIDSPVDSSPAAIITVSDTGIGIASNETDKIFSRTYMSSSARTPSDASGAGLGLAICKSIIEKHNGIIWCQSDSNQHCGSTFFIRLPLIDC